MRSLTEVDATDETRLVSGPVGPFKSVISAARALLDLLPSRPLPNANADAALLKSWTPPPLPSPLLRKAQATLRPPNSPTADMSEDRSGSLSPIGYTPVLRRRATERHMSGH
ncbi:hypothetical protein KIPB_011969 [Kipferlia bialata]|uniref:Uncharacterized protein n=1 Tax=Kipferlia bialata TaxID=797122 RepID=A0A391NQN6_9EUKA|nr:hypothetical protein KIPB_011969 [Kipferlia bialata]|eukprot:g11969.t1